MRCLRTWRAVAAEVWIAKTRLRRAVSYWGWGGCALALNTWRDLVSAYTSEEEQILTVVRALQWHVLGRWLRAWEMFAQVTVAPLAPSLPPLLLLPLCCFSSY